MANQGARTEQATPKKLFDARKKGNVPRSQELSAALVLGVFLLLGKVLGPAWLDEMRNVFVGLFTAELYRAEMTPQSVMGLLGTLSRSLTGLLFVPVAALGVASMAGNLLQGPPPLSFEPMRPDMTKLNPFKGIKKIFRVKALVELAKALLKTVLFCGIVWWTIEGLFIDGFPAMPGPKGTFNAICHITFAIVSRVVALMLILSLLDILFQRWNWKRGLRMSKQEIREERRSMEGDPQVRQRIRGLQMEMSRRRMMAEVPDATVVITNPTHFAVALRFVPGEMAAPVVVAKGVDHVAQRIIAIAKENNVPVRREPPLARALYRAVEVGKVIPESLFIAVAEILALVMRGKRRSAS